MSETNPHKSKIIKGIHLSKDMMGLVQKIRTPNWHVPSEDKPMRLHVLKRLAIWARLVRKKSLRSPQTRIFLQNTEYWLYYYSSREEYKEMSCAANVSDFVKKLTTVLKRGAALKLQKLSDKDTTNKRGLQRMLKDLANENKLVEMSIQRDPGVDNTIVEAAVGLVTLSQKI